MSRLTAIVLVCLVIFAAPLNVNRLRAQQPASTQVVAAIDAGCTPYHGAATTASTNSTEVKNVPARLCDLTLINTTTTIYYIHVYNTATAPTCTTTGATLLHTFPIPPAGAAGGAGGLVRAMGTSGGEIYTIGIGYCVTGGGGDGDNTNAAAGVYVEGSYRTVPP